MRWGGASGITTRFQELFRCTGQVGHALLTRSPLSPRQQAARDPVRLACVKHAASVHPEPESNPPQQTSWRHPTDDSSNPFQKKSDGPSNKEGRSHKNPRHESRPPRATHTKDEPPTQARIGTGIIKDDQAAPGPRQPGHQNLGQVVQYTLLSSQTTTTHPQPPPGKPGRP